LTVVEGAVYNAVDVTVPEPAAGTAT